MQVVNGQVLTLEKALSGECQDLNNKVVKFKKMNEDDPFSGYEGKGSEKNIFYRS